MSSLNSSTRFGDFKSQDNEISSEPVRKRRRLASDPEEIDSQHQNPDWVLLSSVEIDIVCHDSLMMEPS